MTDKQILWEYINSGQSEKPPSILAIIGAIVSILLSTVALIAGLALGYKWYYIAIGLIF